MILFEDIKRDKNDESIFRDSDTGMPVFRVKEGYGKRKIATWHEDMLAIHPELGTGFMPRKIEGEITKSELPSTLNYHYENHAKHDFKNPFRVVPNQKFTLKNSVGEHETVGDHIYDKESGDRIGTAYQAGTRFAANKEFADKNNIDEDVRKTFTNKINSTYETDHLTRYNLLKEYLSHANKKPKVIGVRSWRGADSYKAGEGISQEEAAKIIADHHNSKLKEKLEWKHIGGGNYIAHQDSSYSNHTHHIVTMPNGEIHYFVREVPKSEHSSTKNNTMLF